MLFCDLTKQASLKWNDSMYLDFISLLLGLYRKSYKKWNHSEILFSNRINPKTLIDICDQVFDCR